MSFSLRDVTGSRGENIVELCLTDYARFRSPLFQPAFLGEKWPAIDFYVELNGIKGSRPYFLAQCKTTASTLRPGADHLAISATRNDVARLLKIPGPTYLLGVHEPSQRVFAKSVHSGVAVKAITRIQLTNELTAANLQKLYEEVCDYWRSVPRKPTESVFI